MYQHVFTGEKQAQPLCLCCRLSQAMGAQVGLGGPVLLQGAKRSGGGLPVRLTNGILLLGVQSVRLDAPPGLFRSGGSLSCMQSGTALQPS